MVHRVVIDFDLGETGSDVWRQRAHRVLNFSEDLFRIFRDGDLATHEVQSVATSRLVVQVRSASKVRRTAELVDKMLLEHFSDGIGSKRVEDHPA